MKFIKKYIIEKSGEEVTLKYDKLFFKTKMFTYRGKMNILLPITKGTFQFSILGGNYYLIYRFYMYRMIIIIFLLSFIFALCLSNYSIGVLSFFWIGGGNALLALVRQRFLLNSIGEEIDRISSNSISVEEPLGESQAS